MPSIILQCFMVSKADSDFQYFLEHQSNVLEVYEAYNGLREQDWKVVDATRGQLPRLLRSEALNCPCNEMCGSDSLRFSLHRDEI